MIISTRTCIFAGALAVLSVVILSVVILARPRAIPHGSRTPAFGLLVVRTLPSRLRQTAPCGTLLTVSMPAYKRTVLCEAALYGGPSVVTILDSANGSRVRTLAMPTWVNGLAVDTKTGRIVAGLAFGGGIRVIDSRRGVPVGAIRFPPSVSIMNIAVDAKTRRLYATTDANQFNLAVYDLDTLHQLNSMTVGGASQPHLMVLAGMLYAIGSSPTGTFIEQRDRKNLSVRKVAYVGGQFVASSPVYDPVAHRLLIATTGLASTTSTLYLIDGLTLRVLRHVILPDFLPTIVANASGDQAFVSLVGSGVSYGMALGGSSGQRTYRLGYATSIDAVDTQRGILFTLTFGTTTRPGTLSIVDVKSGRSIDTATVGTEPRSVTYVPQSGYIFVGNAGSATSPASVTVLRLHANR